MTAPALLLMAPGETTEAAIGELRALRASLTDLRPDLLTQLCLQDGGEPSPRAAVASLLRRGAHEIVIVPLRAARVCSPRPTELTLARSLSDRFGVPVTVGCALQATGPLFSLADRRLHAALLANHARELDALILLHDSDGGPLDSGVLERRARIWAARHRLPHRVAVQVSLDPTALTDAIAAHAARGRRHIGVANFSVLEMPDLTRMPAPLTAAVTAVGAPLGGDPAVLTEVLTQYSVAGLLALAETCAS